MSSQIIDDTERVARKAFKTTEEGLRKQLEQIVTAPSSGISFGSLQLAGGFGFDNAGSDTGAALGGTNGSGPVLGTIREEHTLDAGESLLQERLRLVEMLTTLEERERSGHRLTRAEIRRRNDCQRELEKIQSELMT